MFLARNLKNLSTILGHLSNSVSRLSTEKISYSISTIKTNYQIPKIWKQETIGLGDVSKHPDGLSKTISNTSSEIVKHKTNVNLAVQTENHLAAMSEVTNVDIAIQMTKFHFNQKYFLTPVSVLGRNELTPKQVLRIID